MTYDPGVPVATRVSSKTRNAIARVLEAKHISVSEYLRDVIERDLTQRGFLNNQPLQHDKHSFKTRVRCGYQWVLSKLSVSKER